MEVWRYIMPELTVLILASSFSIEFAILPVWFSPISICHACTEGQLLPFAEECDRPTITMRWQQPRLFTDCYWTSASDKNSEAESVKDVAHVSAKID
jgi:hypothetical protein